MFAVSPTLGRRGGDVEVKKGCSGGFAPLHSVSNERRFEAADRRSRCHTGHVSQMVFPPRSRRFVVPGFAGAAPQESIEYGGRIVRPVPAVLLETREREPIELGGNRHLGLNFHNENPLGQLVRVDLRHSRDLPAGPGQGSDLHVDVAAGGQADVHRHHAL